MVRGTLRLLYACVNGRSSLFLKSARTPSGSARALTTASVLRAYGAEMILVSGTIVIDPAKVVRALELTRPLVEATRAEPGCLAYGFYADPQDHSRFLLYEEWEDQAALDAHSASEHLAAFYEAIPELEVTEVVVHQHEVAGRTRII